MSHLRREGRLKRLVTISIGCLLVVVWLFCSTLSSAAELRVQDIFGRDLSRRGVTLVDWDGYIANPLIRFYLFPATNLVLPASAQLTANGPRLYFDTDSAVSSNGPAKVVFFSAKDVGVPVRLSIFPDRDGMDEDYTLTVAFTGADGGKLTNTVPIHVFDQDRSRSNDFAVTVNYDRDVTGFFKDARARDLVERAASDWAYFFAEMNLDPVRSGSETTYIWSNNFNGGYTFTNTNDYRGYLLYAYGTTNTAHRSGGEGSFSGGVQKSAGAPLKVKRSGGFEAEIYGNYNTRGWLFLTHDDQWLVSGNLGNETNDFYSIAHHEIGHALIFNPAHPGFAAAKAAGGFSSAALQNYYGRHAPIDASDHLYGVIDPESGQGVFGYEYYGSIPRKRWLVTKLDLLAAQEVGYVLRDTSAFQSLTLVSNTLATASLDQAYSAGVKAAGGVPAYFYEVVTGSLPPGLLLDSFTGTISGTPTTPGEFPFTIRVRDYHEEGVGVIQEFKITVAQTSEPLLQIARSGAGVNVRAAGPVTAAERFEASADLVKWSPIATNGAASAPFEIFDPFAGLRSRYYRALVP